MDRKVVKKESTKALMTGAISNIQTYFGRFSKQKSKVQSGDSSVFESGSQTTRKGIEFVDGRAGDRSCHSAMLFNEPTILYFICTLRYLTT